VERLEKTSRCRRNQGQEISKAGIITAKGRGVSDEKVDTKGRTRVGKEIGSLTNVRMKLKRFVRCNMKAKLEGEEETKKGT